MKDKLLAVGLTVVAVIVAMQINDRLINKQFPVK